MQHKMQHEKKETLIFQGFQSGDGGIRTHGRFDPSTDFESFGVKVSQCFLVLVCVNK